MRCRECGAELRDRRWSPLCAVCHEGIHHEQRRLQIRPPELDAVGWIEPTQLDAAFDQAMGPELP
jgi:hypothetical protein